MLGSYLCLELNLELVGVENVLNIYVDLGYIIRYRIC